MFRVKISSQRRSGHGQKMVNFAFKLRQCVGLGD